MVASFDQFLRSLGEPGRFNIIAFLFLWSNTFPLAFNNYIMVFYGIPPAHHCKIPQNDSLEWTASDQCFKTILDSANRTQETPVGMNMSSSKTGCDLGWEYDGPKNSIVSEWDLVCDRKWDASLSTSIYFVGVMLGSMAGGLLGDLFGRQPVILVTMYLQAALGLGVAFVPSFQAFVALRFFHAFVLQAMQGCSFTLTMELFRPRMRTVAGTLSSMAWPLSTMLLALITYSLDDWRHVQLALTLPSIISFAYFWFIPESLRWLVSLQKVEQAQKLATKIAKFNKVQTPTTELCAQLAKISKECAAESMAGNNGKMVKHSAVDLVRTPTIRKFTFIVAFLWFTASLVVYGISFSLPKLGANIYVSFGISGAIEFAIRFIMFYVLDRFGRKWPTVITMIASGAFCAAVPLLQSIASGATADWLAMIAAIIGKSFMSACFSIIPMYTTELYPTVIRSLGQGMAVFATRIGGILAPQLGPLAEIWKPAPFIICGCVGVTAGFLTLFLPETNRLPMPDMIDDLEKNGKKKQKKSKGDPGADEKQNGTVDLSEKSKLASNGIIVHSVKENDLQEKTVNGKSGKENETFEMEEELHHVKTSSPNEKEKLNRNGIVNAAFEPEEKKNEKVEGNETNSKVPPQIVIESVEDERQKVLPQNETTDAIPATPVSTSAGDESQDDVTNDPTIAAVVADMESQVPQVLEDSVEPHKANSEDETDTNSVTDMSHL